MRRLALLAILTLTLTASAQWDIQDSHTKASLRGIHSLGNGVAWASGTGGTVLRTLDNGANWQHCTIPPGAEKLDFRGVQAFDAQTAIVMSSGKGDASRLYQTTDGCKTWALVATNPDQDGFWDAAILKRRSPANKDGMLYILGDPVRERFVVLFLQTPWKPGEELKRYSVADPRPKAMDGESAFAASNSALQVGYVGIGIAFGTGGGKASHWYRADPSGDESGSWHSSMIPIGNAGPSSGMFSVVFRPADHGVRWWDISALDTHRSHAIGVAVGGDFQKPDDGSASAVYTSTGGNHWLSPVAGAMPHGYRSAVAYDPTTKTWITVGPNGTDISTDDGRNWRALTPTSTDQPDADKHWNALSLPFVVGEHGHIAILRPTALKP